MMCAMVSMFRAEVGMKVFLPFYRADSGDGIQVIRFYSTDTSEQSLPLDFTRNSNGSLLPLSSSLDLTCYLMSM